MMPTHPIIPRQELARRLCEAAHPHIRSTGQPVPCGEHLRQADFTWSLTQTTGTSSFEVIAQARRENNA